MALLRLLALLMPVRMVPPSVGSIFDGVVYESGFDGWVLLQQRRHPPVGVGVHGVDAPRDNLLVGCDLDVDVVDVGGVEWEGHRSSIWWDEVFAFTASANTSTGSSPSARADSYPTTELRSHLLTIIGTAHVLAV
jgi:hypothetical protein